MSCFTLFSLLNISLIHSRLKKCVIYNLPNMSLRIFHDPRDLAFMIGIFSKLPASTECQPTREVPEMTKLHPKVPRCSAAQSGCNAPGCTMRG